MGSAYSYSITAIDADGDALAITSLEVPTWLTLTDNGNGTASLSGTPATFGSFDVKIQVSDGKVNVEQDFTVVVVATGIADNNIQNVTVYPNPASNELYLTNADGSNLQIFDMLLSLRITNKLALLIPALLSASNAIPPVIEPSPMMATTCRFSPFLCAATAMFL